MIQEDLFSFSLSSKRLKYSSTSGMTPAIGVFIFLSLGSAGLDIGIKKKALKIAINKAVTVKRII